MLVKTRFDFIVFHSMGYVNKCGAPAVQSDGMINAIRKFTMAMHSQQLSYGWLLSEIPPPSVSDIAGRSITVNWDEPPPELAGDLKRNITQYAITLTPQDGGPPQTFSVPAEAGTEYELTGLMPETTYELQINAVINTDGQGEEIYDIGIPQINVDTGEIIKEFLIHKYCISELF